MRRLIVATLCVFNAKAARMQSLPTLSGGGSVTGRDIAAEVQQEFDNGLFPKEKALPKVRGSDNGPTVFNLGVLSAAESHRDSSKAPVLAPTTKKQPPPPLADDTHPSCFVLEDLMTYLKIMEVELTTSWPAWISKYADWETQLGETRNMYMTLTNVMSQKTRDIEQCISEGSANCADTSLASIASNAVMPGGVINETAVALYRNASLQKLERVKAENTGATSILTELNLLHSSSINRSAAVAQFRSMLGNVTSIFTTKSKVLQDMRETHCQAADTKGSTDVVCQETVQAWEEMRLSFSSYYKATMGELHEMDLRLAAIDTGDAKSCPYQGPMVAHLEELADKCPPLEKTTRGLQNFLMDWEAWKTSTPILAKNLRGLSGHVENELGMLSKFSGNDTEAYIALNSTGLEVTKLKQELHGFARGAATWTYEAARLSNFALGEIFELRGSIGCVEFDVKRRMGAPVNCGGMKEWYTTERNALEAEMQMKSLSFQKDLRILKERAWKFKCTASVDLPPEEPGCWAITPSGCPLHPNEAVMTWTRDEFGEKQYYDQFGVNISKFECIVTRRVAFQTYCGTVVVELYYSPPKPVSAGCWVYTPSGCPNDPSYEDARLRFARDQEGEDNHNALLDQQACVVERKLAFDQRCGVDDTRMVWKGSTTHPVSPGCWYHTPLGCPSQPMAQLAIDSWQNDKFGAATIKADINETACLQVRKKAWQEFCGTDNVMVHFVPPGGAPQPPPPPPPPTTTTTSTTSGTTTTTTSSTTASSAIHVSTTLNATANGTVSTTVGPNAIGSASGNISAKDTGHELGAGAPAGAALISVQVHTHEGFLHSKAKLS